MSEEPIEVYRCEMCDKPVPSYKPQYCCSGFDCGCRGMAIEPCICSNKCWDRMMNRKPALNDGKAVKP